MLRARRVLGLSKPPGIPALNPGDPIHTNCTFLACVGASPWSLIPVVEGIPQNGSPKYAPSLLGNVLKLESSSNNGLEWGVIGILDGATSAGFSFWIAVLSNIDARLFSRWGGTASEAQFFFDINASGGPTIGFGTTNGVGGYNIAHNPTALTLGILYHCVILWSAPNNITFYINAAPQTTAYEASDTVASMRATATSSLQLGYNTSQNINPPDAYIDCIRVWKNRLLTNADIMQLYANPWAGLLWPRDLLPNVAVTATSVASGIFLPPFIESWV